MTPFIKNTNCIEWFQGSQIGGGEVQGVEGEGGEGDSGEGPSTTPLREHVEDRFNKIVTTCKNSLLIKLLYFFKSQLLLTTSQNIKHFQNHQKEILQVVKRVY